MGKVIDLTGQTFGELTVLRRAGSDHGATWVCLCSCGVECVKLGHKMVSGHTKTCGHSTAKTPEEMREYKKEWAREHTGLQGRPKNCKNQNTDKTHCIRGHEFTPENTRMFGENKEQRKCLICHREDSRQRMKLAYAEYRAARKADPVRYAKLKRRRRALQLKKIGWTIERFEKQWEVQEAKCAVCHKVLNQDYEHNGAKAHADHEHIVPPKPREILCGNCNVGLGNFQDNPEILRAAAAYVEKWKE